MRRRGIFIVMKRVLFFTVLSAVSFWWIACDTGLSFDEYDGENFLTAATLSSGSWVLMPDYADEFDDEGTDADDYMDYSATGATGPQGGPVYRLEIKNLLQNGDFELNTKTPWDYLKNDTNATADPPADAKMLLFDSGANALDNYTAHVQTDEQEYLRFELKSGFVTQETYVPEKNYLFHFDYRTTSQLFAYYIPDWTNDPSLSDAYYQANGGAEGANDPPSLSNLTNRNTYPPLSPVDDQKKDNRFTASATPLGTNTDSLSLVGNAEDNQEGYVDNFRVIRESEGDFDLRLRIKLNIDHNSDLDLIDGYYKFSVYVRQEGTLPGNTFHADRVELGINGYDRENQKSVEENKVFYKTQALASAYATTTGTYAGDWSSQWVQLEFASQTLIQLSQTADDPVLELTISPSNPGNTDSSWNRLKPGSLLIADPRLEYSGKPW